MRKLEQGLWISFCSDRILTVKVPTGDSSFSALVTFLGSRSDVERDLQTKTALKALFQDLETLSFCGRWPGLYLNFSVVPSPCAVRVSIAWIIERTIGKKESGVDMVFCCKRKLIYEGMWEHECSPGGEENKILASPGSFQKSRIFNSNFLWTCNVLSRLFDIGPQAENLKIIS